GPPMGPPNREQLLRDLVLPEHLHPPGEGPPPVRCYFAVRRSDGTLLKAAGIPPEITTQEIAERPRSGPRPHQRGEFREWTMRGPHGTTITVGRSVRREVDDLRSFAWQLTGAGVVVLAVGLAGGWVISARILKPIAAISATASTMSETSLSERIDTTKVDRELLDLAEVLNETFARLQAAFERQVRFTADASHELRTPLAIMRSQAELTLGRSRTPEELREALKTCLSASTRMTELV